MKKTFAFIFARGGSKGVPRKNVRLLAGKPLIAHSIDLALSIPEISKVIVSTDDPEIAAVAREHGAEVPFLRPAELAGDHASEWKAWQHAVTHVQEKLGESFDRFISLPATAPLRSAEDVTNCFARFGEGGADLVFCVTPSARSPYFNMVKLDGEHRAELVIKPVGEVIRRQDVPEVYDITTVAYVTTPGFILSRNGVFDGVTKAVIIPAERAIDIDTPLDFEFAEFLALKRQHQD
ncbi:MAG: acylneuraminate cytidylyltransferase family protein [Akkermansiaceae bacterium]|nr:acylneuraminate cytidylyltransferase family protein [Akkermansiaceae bacterium]